MRCHFALLAVVLLLTSAATAFAVADRTGPLPAQMVPLQDRGDIPAAVPGGGGALSAPDTVNFGYFTVIGGNLYAVQNDSWTFDHDPTQPFEGWYCIDETQNPGAYFRQITSSIWSSDPNNVEPAPVITGAGSAWVGFFESHADSLCWDCGLGYGNNWCQNLDSPILQYNGVGSVHLQFNYFEDSELNFDYTHVFLKVGSTTTQLNTPGFTGKIGLPTSPANFSFDISSGDFGGSATPYTIEFEFASDGGWSDEDGHWCTTYGPFCVDDVQIGSNSYNFDASLQGWTPHACPGIGSFLTITPVQSYTLQDPCTCRLVNNVMGFADNNGKHPVGELEGAWSPPADRSSQFLQQHNEIFAQWDSYGDMPKANGVFYRPGFNYYPFTCPVTGQSQWSGRQGQTKWFYIGNTPVCFISRAFANDWGIPPSCQDIGFVYELYSSCDAFGIPPSGCTGVTNFTPIIDNVRLRMTGIPNAPVVGYGDGTYYQDGFGQSLLLSTTNAGNADITVDLRFPTTTGLPDLLGDSLAIAGPLSTTSTEWLSKLWFRIRREGPGNSSINGYTTWKNRVTRSLGNIVGASAPFTWGIMDSVIVSGRSAPNKFFSNFSELDNLYIAPNGGKQDAIIPDGILGPGTQIQYFVTAYYVCTPTVAFVLPDTTGKFYSEFQILPSYRNVSGVPKFPCVMYVQGDATPLTKISQVTALSNWFVERALNKAINGVYSPVPNPAPWDEFQYTDAASNWHGTFFRGVGADDGAPLPQLMGYSFMMCDLGTNPAGAMDTRDWQGFDSWLNTTICGKNAVQQGVLMAGDEIVQGISGQYPAFLTDLGSYQFCPSVPYYDPSCANDQNKCVDLAYNSGGPFQPSLSYDLWGNWCPQRFSFSVLGTASGGVGNKNFVNIKTNAVEKYAQVTNDASALAGKYRTVLNGYSLMHMITRSNPDTCPAADTLSVYTAAAADLKDAIKWTLNIGDPSVLASLCVDACTDRTDVPPSQGIVDGGLINRLYQNSPNPFNPRTTISFSLAAAGPAKLLVYDITGRKVRTLVNGVQPAGTHQVIWDGTNDAGQKVPAGVYWSQLSAGSYNSNKKMVVLK